MPRAQTHSRPSGCRFAVALSILAASLGIALAAGASSSAQTQELEAVRSEQQDVRAQLAEQNAAVDALIGEVSALRVREDRVATELAEQEAELAAARVDLAEARDALAETKRRLQGAVADLEELLVSIYRHGEIDEVSVLLNADGLDDLATTSAYLDRIRDYETGVVVKVRDLRTAASAYVDQVEGSIERMETARAAIVDRQEALAASRATLEQREAELQAAQDERREQLAELQGEERSLVRALAPPPPAPPEGDSEAPAAPAEPVASPGGSAATRSPVVPTNGAAVTARSSRPATTARGRSATRSMAAGSSRRRWTPRAS
jgi:septal ring factor EnvC (AmiA/AmiB activator)